MRNLVIVMVAAGGLIACAGREPNLQPVAQGGDNEKGCEQLLAEMNANAATAESKIKTQKSRDEGDVAIGVAGALLFWPALFAIDTKNADGHEGNGLLDRNSHLQTLAIRKGCDISAVPAVLRYE
jgi:hypothetical protein